MPRSPYLGLKPIKEQIAAGNLDQAFQALLGRRDALLITLSKTSDTEAETILKCRLTLIEIKLAVVASLSGDFTAADEWFLKVHEYFAAFDPVTDDRMRREEATHLLRKGMVREAHELFTRTEREFRVRLRFGRTSVPKERLELEHAITLSCKAEAELLLDPRDKVALKTLRDVQPTLQAGNKPRYEMDNLMRLIEYTSVFDRLRPLYIARASWLNETAVHNPVIRLSLIDASCGPVPLKSFIQRLGIARD